MIEAVNSVISNAQALRGSAEQMSSAKASEVSVAPAPKAPYISPFISVNSNFDTAVLQIRDSDTGDVIRQFPSESTLKARRAAEAVTSRPQVPEVVEKSSEGSSSGGEDGISSVNVAEAQQAASALSTAASAQTTEITQATINVTA